MRTVVQRVTSAAVHVGDEEIAHIGHGFVVLLGVAATDRAEDGERLAAKILDLRVFDDERGRLDRTVRDVAGTVLVVPQFTLYGDVRRGRRPDFTTAAPPEQGRRLYEAFCGVLRGADVPVAQGRFGADMRVDIAGDGPVTIVISTDGWNEAELGKG